MTRRVKWLAILAWLMVGAAIWQMVTFFPYLNLDLTGDYLTLPALAFFGELTVDILPVGRLSTGFAVLLAAQLVYGAAPAVRIWTLATLMGQGTANRGNSLQTTIFNAAQYTLAAVWGCFVPRVPHLLERFGTSESGMILGCDHILLYAHQENGGVKVTFMCHLRLILRILERTSKRVTIKCPHTA